MPSIDYAKLAAQHGGTAPVDYGALAESLGGKASDAAPKARQNQPASNWERFKSRLPDLAGITQVPAALKDLAAQPAGIVDKAISGAIGDLVDPVPQYKALRARGQSPVYSALGSIPLVGPAADVITQDIYHGRVPEMIGDAVSMAPALLGLKSVQNSKLMRTPVADIAASAKAVAKDAGKGVANAASDVRTYGAMLGGAELGSRISGPTGAAIGAVGGTALKVGSDVWKSIKAGLMSRESISGAKAESMMLKMPPEKLAALGEQYELTPAQVAERAAKKAAVSADLKARQKAYWDARDAAEAKAKPAPSTPKPESAPEAPKAATEPVKAAPKATNGPTLDPIMMPAKNDAGVGPLNITAKLQDHPAYKGLVDQIRGKSQEEALKILADAELKDWLMRPTMEMAGLEAPTPKAVRAAVEAVKDRNWDAWQRTAGDVGEGDVVTRPHPGQASPAFVNERLKYLQEQAAKRGNGPEEFKAKAAANKSKGAELAAALDGSEVPKAPTARQQGEALHEKAKARKKAKE